MPARIAYVTDQIPRPDRAGYLAYNHGLIQALATRGNDVTLVLVGTRLAWPVADVAAFFDPARVRAIGPGLVRVGSRVVLKHPRTAAQALARGLVRSMPGAVGERLRQGSIAMRHGQVDGVLGLYLSDDQARQAAALADGADIVMVDTIFRAAVLRHLRRTRRRAIITHDVFSARHAMLSGKGLKLIPASLTEAEEAAWLAEAELLVAIQAAEAAVLRQLAPAARVVVAPMPAAAVPRPAGTPREAGRIAYVGSVAPHNVDGMRWFLAEVWPRLVARAPGIRLDVCGTVGNALGDPPPGVTLHGMVDDLAPILHRACLAIAPLRAGSGQAIKVIAYASHGLVTVTTPAGADGYAAAHGAPLEIADGAEEFAICVAALGATDGMAREASAMAFVAAQEAGTVLAPFAEAIEGAPETATAGAA